MIRLEERSCACLCGLTFRVMPKSTQRFASTDHADYFGKSQERTGPTREELRRQSQLLTGEEIARHLRVSPTTINNWRLQGRISGEMLEGLGRKFHYRLSEVLEQIQRKGRPLMGRPGARGQVAGKRQPGVKR